MSYSKKVAKIIFTLIKIKIFPASSVAEVSQTPPDDDNKDDLPVYVLQSPSEEFGLNLLLHDINQNLSSEETGHLKRFFQGPKGLPGGVLEEIQSAAELFDRMRLRKMISNDNLILLQSVLWHIGRNDLHRKTTEYARKAGNTLYFYAPKETPENGYKYVKFHVGGTERYKRSHLQKLRNLVSDLLGVPREFIFISGIEVTSSLYITLMVPEDYVFGFPALLDSDGESFDELGIDKIFLDGTTYKIATQMQNPGDKEQETRLSSFNTELVEVYSLLSRVEEEREAIEVDHFKLTKALQKAQDGKQLTEIDDQPTFSPMGLKALVWLTLLRHYKKQVKELNYDTNVVMHLLNAQEKLIGYKLQELNRLRFEKLQLQVRELQEQLFWSRLRMEAMVFNTGVVPQIDIRFALRPEIKDLLTKFDKKLKPRERTKLQKLYDLEYPNDALPNIVLKEGRCRVILLQEMVTTVTKCLQKIGRKDLCKSFEEETLKFIQGEQQKFQQPPAPKDDKVATEKNSTSNKILESLQRLETRLGNVENKLQTPTVQGVGNIFDTYSMFPFDYSKPLSAFPFKSESPNLAGEQGKSTESDDGDLYD